MQSFHHSLLHPLLILFRARTNTNKHAVISYHPPLFASFKRLTQSSARQRVALAAAAAGVAVYSPHTAVDAMRAGVNEYLLARLDVPTTDVAVVKTEGQNDAGDDVGAGRRARLATPTSLATLVENVKRTTGLAHVRLARAHVDGKRVDAAAAMVSAVAVCAGAGGSVVGDVDDVELLVTGEMSHHELLAIVESGRSVLLLEHSNSERGHLEDMAAQLRYALEPVKIILSQTDADPVEIV